jgi:hypothetical protein
MLLLSEERAARAALRVFALHPLEIVAGAGDGDFSRAQFAREPITLELIAIDLGCDLIDLRLDGLQLSLGFLTVRLRGRRGCGALREHPKRAAERNRAQGFARGRAPRLRSGARQYWGARHKAFWQTLLSAPHARHEPL